MASFKDVVEKKELHLSVGETVVLEIEDRGRKESLEVLLDKGDALALGVALLKGADSVQELEQLLSFTKERYMANVHS